MAPDEITQDTQANDEKILFFIKNRCFVDANHLFYENYSDSNPPGKDTVLRMFLEYKRQEAFVEAFDFLRKVIPWFPDDPELIEAEKLARKLLYDLLVVKGNTIWESALAKTREILDVTGGVGKVNKQKLIEENQKSVREIVQKALEVFSEAHELLPDGVEALGGLRHCYQDLGQTELAEKYQQRVVELRHKNALANDAAATAAGNGGSPANGRMPPTAEMAAAAAKEREIEANLDEANRLFLADNHQDALTILEKLLTVDGENRRGLLLAARCNLELRQFHQTEKILDRALRLYPTDEDVIAFKSNLAENKFSALTEGGTEFLRKGIELGPMLGQRYFENAIQCYEHALKLNPDDILLLDQLYTAYQFLGLEEKARRTRVELYRIDPGFVSTWEKSEDQGICFLAGFAYRGDHEALRAFRSIRREVLLPSLLGRRLVTSYVRWSPRLVKTLRAFGVPALAVRILLHPLRQWGQRVAARARNGVATGGGRAADIDIV